MDFKQCFDILANRACSQDEVCSCCKKTQPTSINETKDERDNDKEISEITVNNQDSAPQFVETHSQERSIIQLVELLIDIQNSRLKIYKKYDDELSIIIANDMLNKYPVLCAQNTGLFTSLSREVISIKEEITLRGKYSSLVQTIEKIQSIEKEKLLLVAAHQLERMKSKLPDLIEAVGKDCEVQKIYISNKLSGIQETLTEYTEELMCHRIELLEEESVQ